MFCCLRSETDVDGVVVSVAHCSQTGTVALQLEDGQIRKLLWGQFTLCLPTRTFHSGLVLFFQSL